MRILYLSQYFPPEVGATQTRAYEMARGLACAGHEVTVIAEVPNHPSGIISKEFRGKIFDRSDVDGIEVIRVWVKTSPVKNFRTRIAFYISFMFMAIFAGLFFARKKYDAIYATSPPLFVGAAGLVLSFLRRILFVFEVRDLWPESAVVLGELRNPKIIRWAEWLEWRCYRRAWRIVVVTHGIEKRLLERGVPQDRILFIPNGANTELFTPGPVDLDMRRQLGIPVNSFVIVYTGLHGLIHGMEVILHAAAELLKKNVSEHEALFLLIGEGVAKPELMKVAKTNNLTNVLFLASQPEVMLPAFVRLANAGVATTARLALTEGTLPVKMFSYMACALPVLLAVNGEAKNLIEDAEAGLCIPPGDGAALAHAVVELMNNSEQCRSLGENGRRYVVNHYSRQSQARQLAEILKEIDD